MYDEELEKAMLYYLIFEQEEYLLDEEDFTSDRNKKIIKAINQLKAEKQEISMLSVKAKIKANGKQVMDYIVSLGEYIQTTTSDAIYNNLINLSKKRKISKLLHEKIMEILECEDVDILAEETIKEINKIEQVNEKEKTFLEQVVETTDRIEKSVLEGQDYSLYTGIRDLDNIICGLHKEELTIVGARPRSWKNNISFTNSRIHSK